MSFRALRHFVVVAEELHMHRAAERLHIAQPALSQQIKQLEQRLGVVLFSRANRRLTLTAAGEAFCRRRGWRWRWPIRRYWTPSAPREASREIASGVCLQRDVRQQTAGAPARAAR
jgi:hypothetical protein